MQRCVTNQARGVATGGKARLVWIVMIACKQLQRFRGQCLLECP